MNCLRLALLFSLVGSTMTAEAAVTDTPTGLWLSHKGDVAIAITQCATVPDKLCGAIAWLRSDAPTVAADGKPLCGTIVLSDFVQDAKDASQWTDGTIYVADKGATYNGQLHLTAPDQLELRGYLGTPLVGKTKQLHRVTTAAYPACSVK